MLDAIPDLSVDDRGVQAVVDLALVAKSSEIDWVREDPVDAATRSKAAAYCSASSSDPNRRANVFGIKSGLQSNHAANLEVAPEKFANELGMFLHDMKARFSTRYPNGTAPPIQMPLFFEAATLSRMRSRMREAIAAVFRFAVATGRAENDPTFALRGALAAPKVRHPAAITNPTAFGALLRAIDGFEGHSSD